MKILRMGSINDVVEGEYFFDLLLFILAIIFVVSAGIPFLKKMKEKKENSSKAIESKTAKVITKRNSSIMSSTPNVCFVLFEFEDGNRRELSMNLNVSAIIAENDIGILTFQGTKFINFERSINNIQSEIEKNI